MNCKEVRSHFFDLVSGEPVPAHVAGHVPSCAECAKELEALRSTMATLDEWKAPEDVSPYFMTRLMARVREENSAPSASWFSWARRPVLAASMAVILVAAGGLSMLRMGGTPEKTREITAQAEAQLRVGTAVGDLQYLEGHSDLLAEFELLDEMGVSN
ncbi:MAG: anti-sigma factor [Candidatus Korobacteraceae bacterium]